MAANTTTVIGRDSIVYVSLGTDSISNGYSLNTAATLTKEPSAPIIATQRYTYAQGSNIAAGANPTYLYQVTGKSLSAARSYTMVPGPFSRGENLITIYAGGVAASTYTDIQITDPTRGYIGSEVLISAVGTVTPEGGATTIDFYRAPIVVYGGQCIESIAPNVTKKLTAFVRFVASISTESS